MPPFVLGTLAAALLLSASGAVIVCLMVVLFGFNGPDDEPPLTTARRLMYIRIGHALATTCFAATAILIGMVLIRSARPAPAAVAHDARIPELDARLDRHASRVAEIEARARDANAGVARTETQLRDLEQSLGRVADEERRTEHRVGRLEQSEARASTATRAAAARKPSVVAPPVAVRAPEPTPAPVERSIPAPPPAPTLERVVPPPATPSTSVSDTEVPSAASPPSKDRSKERGPVETSATSTTSESPTSGGVRAKLRQDWTAVQKGFESSRDDVRRAFDVTMRKLRDLVQ